MCKVLCPLLPKGLRQLGAKGSGYFHYLNSWRRVPGTGQKGIPAESTDSKMTLSTHVWLTLLRKQHSL